MRDPLGGLQQRARGRGKGIYIHYLGMGHNGGAVIDFLGMCWGLNSAASSRKFIEATRDRTLQAWRDTRRHCCDQA